MGDAQFCPDTDLTGCSRQTSRTGAETQKEAEKRPKRQFCLAFNWQNQEGGSLFLTRLKHEWPQVADTQFRHWNQKKAKKRLKIQPHSLLIGWTQVEDYLFAPRHRLDWPQEADYKNWCWYKSRLKKGWKDSPISVWWQGPGQHIPCFLPSTDLTGHRRQMIKTDTETQNEAVEKPKRQQYFCLMSFPVSVLTLNL